MGLRPTHGDESRVSKAELIPNGLRRDFRRSVIADFDSCRSYLLLRLPSPPRAMVPVAILLVPKPHIALSLLSSRIGSRSRGQKEPMPPKVKENKEFAKWLRNWTIAIQQNRRLVEHTPQKTKTFSAHLFGLIIASCSGRDHVRG
jgi:hypothetical protein